MPKTPKQRPIRADITPEMDADLDKLVGLYKLRGDQERGDRSKVVRYAVEKLINEMRAEIEKAEAAAKVPAAPRKPR